MKLLLISNSTNAREPYLQYPMPRIDEFLGPIREVVFVPYAAGTCLPMPNTRPKYRPVLQRRGSRSAPFTAPRIRTG